MIITKSYILERNNIKRVTTFSFFTNEILLLVFKLYKFNNLNYITASKSSIIRVLLLIFQTS